MTMFIVLAGSDHDRTTRTDVTLFRPYVPVHPPHRSRPQLNSHLAQRRVTAETTAWAQDACPLLAVTVTQARAADADHVAVATVEEAEGQAQGAREPSDGAPRTRGGDNVSDVRAPSFFVAFCVGRPWFSVRARRCCDILYVLCRSSLAHTYVLMDTAMECSAAAHLANPCGHTTCGECGLSWLQNCVCLPTLHARTE
jgi:hypothetical protein